MLKKILENIEATAVGYLIGAIISVSLYGIEILNFIIPSILVGLFFIVIATWILE